jgi:hypothetical protein
VTSAPTTEPPEPERPFLPRWVLWLALPGLLGPVAIFAFILRSEAVHDPERCPFTQRERREVAAKVFVIEEARSCVEGLEDRRYSVERNGHVRVIGERRLPADELADNHHRWVAEIKEDEVQVTLVTESRGEVLLREGTPEERAKYER